MRTTTPVNTQSPPSASEKWPTATTRTVLSLRGALLIGLILASLIPAGCGPEKDPAAPGPPGNDALTGLIPPAALQACPWPRGTWSWSWRTTDDPGAIVVGEALLHITSAADGQRWRWILTPPPPENRDLDLTPRDTGRWLAMNVAPGDTTGTAWLPLPRVEIASGHHSDLVDLVRTLTLPYFGAVVTGWSAEPHAPGRAFRPLPIHIGEAVSGEVDLAACLREAVRIWNAGAEPAWFVEEPDAPWGIHLLHYPDRRLTPSLYAHITRTDDAGRPARINVVIGNNRADREDSVYVVRAFIHELAHTLLLWGHSDDRTHVLWSRSLPLVTAPSLDERKAARLWHGLPEGLDLRRYRIVTPPATRKAPWPPDGRP